MAFQLPPRVRSAWEKLPRKRICKTARKVGQILLTIGLICVITGCIVACVLTAYIAINFTGEANLPDVDAINQHQSTVVLTYNDRTAQYEEFQRLQGVNRIWVDYADMPSNLLKAVVAIEDERFWEHYGVDWKRTILAFANLILHFNSRRFGGSTLTQQLVKNLNDDDDKTAQRKVREILTAIQMEKVYSKEEILQAYLNILPLTGDIEGVGAGAKYYFGVSVQDLTLAQCAVLAGITQNPAQYNPYTHPKALISRQRTVLKKMHELGFINSDEYQQALGEELYFTPYAGSTNVYDYYTDMLIDDVVDDLVETYGYTESQAKTTVFYGGLKIYSCEKPELQAKVEAVYADENNFPKLLSTDTQNPQGAIYIMDYTGKCVAVAGGRGQKTANRVLNRATDSLRQPGSSIKPLAVYAPAIQLNLINFSSPVKNCYITLRDGTKWPRNYDQSRPQNLGMTVVDIAIQSSMNTVAAQVMQQLTPQRSFEFLTGALRISSLVTSDSKGNTDIDYAPMTLGGLTKGVYPREMAAAYQMFGNGGYYNEPYSYTKVMQGNEVLLEHKSTGVQVLDADSAYIMNRLLQHVVTGSYGATARALSGAWSGWEVFCKTGTTQTNNDVWLVGGTPQYVAASWFGYDQNQALTGAQTSTARNLWNKCMLAIRSGDIKTFGKSSGTVEAKFCYQTGLLATSGCTRVGTGVYKTGQLPEVCGTHAGTPLNNLPGKGNDSTSTVPTTAGTTAATTTVGTTEAAATATH